MTDAEALPSVVSLEVGVLTRHLGSPEPTERKS